MTDTIPANRGTLAVRTATWRYNGDCDLCGQALALGEVSVCATYTPTTGENAAENIQLWHPVCAKAIAEGIQQALAP